MKLVSVNLSVYIINLNSYHNKHTDILLRTREFIILITIFKKRTEPVKIMENKTHYVSSHNMIIFIIYYSI